jgi:hypothetical protein
MQRFPKRKCWVLEKAGGEMGKFANDKWKTRQNKMSTEICFESDISND